MNRVIFRIVSNIPTGYSSTGVSGQLPEMVCFGCGENEGGGGVKTV